MKAIIYNNLGRILRLVDAPEDYLIIQKQPDEFILFGTANDVTQYIDVESGEIRDKPIKPEGDYTFNWQTKQWDYLPEQHKQSVLSQINQLASRKINTTYPIYRQLNIEADFGKDSTEYQIMRTFINSVRTASNNATAQIQTAETEDEINTSFDNYKSSLDTL